MILLAQIIQTHDSHFNRLRLDLNSSSDVKDFKKVPEKNNSPKINLFSLKNINNSDKYMSGNDAHLSHKTQEKFSEFSQVLRKNTIITSNDRSKIRQLTRRLSKKIIKNPLHVISDKILTITSIKNKVIEDYTKLGFKPTTEGKREIINQWKKVLDLSLNVDPKLFINSLKCLGDIYLEFDNYESAKHYYYNYKFFSFYMELLDDLIIAYESLGNVYKFMFQYHKAIKCYKKQIEISWVTNNKHAELRAYDNIGIQYFYLGNKEKAKYYHERMIYGRVESLNSDMRELVLKNYRNKNFYLFNDDKFMKNIKSADELQRKLK
jgi:tetratricopeptide (TPR) repeat protein